MWRPPATAAPPGAPPWAPTAANPPRGGRPRLAPVDPDRDELALRVLPAALRAGLPVLGICRGLQELNVALGGTLRDLPDDRHREDLSQPRDRQYRPAHKVDLPAGGMLR